SSRGNQHASYNRRCLRVGVCLQCASRAEIFGSESRSRAASNLQHVEDVRCLRAVRSKPWLRAGAIRSSGTMWREARSAKQQEEMSASQLGLNPGCPAGTTRSE